MDLSKFVILKHSRREIRIFCCFFLHYIHVKKFVCEDISAEYEFESEKFKGIPIDLKLNNLDLSGNTTEFKTTQPRSQGLRGETVTKTLVKFISSFQKFGEKIACAVRHNRIAIQFNTVVSHCACDFFPKILER